MILITFKNILYIRSFRKKNNALEACPISLEVNPAFVEVEDQKFPRCVELEDVAAPLRLNHGAGIVLHNVAETHEVSGSLAGPVVGEQVNILLDLQLNFARYNLKRKLGHITVFSYVSYLRNVYIYLMQEFI